MSETFSVLDNNNLFIIPALSIFLKEWCSTVVLKTLFPFFMGKIWNVWENSCYRINYAKKGEAFLSFLWRKRLMSVRLRVYSAAKMLNAVSSTPNWRKISLLKSYFSEIRVRHEFKWFTAKKQASDWLVNLVYQL